MIAEGDTFIIHCPLSIINSVVANSRTNWNLTLGNTMEQRRIIALGFFDGVHLGHQALLRRCRELADQHNCMAVALTFSAHPETLVAGQAPALINTNADRSRLMRTFGMEEVIVLPFDREMMSMPWEDFFHMLRQEYGAAGLVCGRDFRFGRFGQGTSEILEHICGEYGIFCSVVEDERIGEIKVSSTHIRNLLETGELEQANRFLGHPHLLTGQVVTGRSLGRTLGFPTANILLPDGVVHPKYGVYACKTEVEGKRYIAVTNVGSRPTVQGHQVRTESWLLDFEGDLYGKELTLEFYAFLRPEQKFASLEELTAAVKADSEKSRAFFAKS